MGTKVFSSPQQSVMSPFPALVLAAVAEQEARAISDRTTAALKAAKRRGVKLGSSRPGHWTGREGKRDRGLRKAIKAASEARSREAANAYAFLIPELSDRRERGDTLQAIAEWLNDAGHSTRAGKPWTPTSVFRVLDRYSPDSDDNDD